MNFYVFAVIKIASDYRGLMCQFGEAVTPTMLNLCADERNISNQIIRFFITQVTIHHPDGSVDITQGTNSFNLLKFLQIKI